MNKTFDAIQVEEIYKINGNMRAFIVLVVLAVLAFIVYREPLWGVISSVLHRKDSSHGLCVPFIAGYLVWFKFERIKKATPKFALVPGMVMGGIGLLLFFLGGESTGVGLPFLSFLLVAAGLVVGLFGGDVFKELGFPLFFLATMIPVPKLLYAQLTEWMRMATTSGSVGMLQLFYFPIYREGYSITLPNINLFVAGGCSGIRYLVSYFVFGLAYAFVCKKGMKSRILVVLAAIPMSIIGGVLRLSFIFLSAYYIGPFMAGHRPHVLISWSVFVTVLVGAIGVDRYVSKRKLPKVS